GRRYIAGDAEGPNRSMKVRRTAFRRQFRDLHLERRADHVDVLRDGGPEQVLPEGIAEPVIQLRIAFRPGSDLDRQRRLRRKLESTRLDDGQDATPGEQYKRFAIDELFTAFRLAGEIIEREVVARAFRQAVQGGHESRPH